MSAAMATSAVIPVLLTERSSPGVFGVMDLALDESLQDPTRTVADLVRTLNDKLSSATQPDADVIRVVTNIKLYGAILRRTVSLASLVLELSGSSPRLVATTYLASRAADMTITVKMLTGQTVLVRCGIRDTVLDVKRKIEESEGIPEDQQRVIFEQRELEDGHTLLECGVGPNSTLVIVLRLRGGGGGPIAFANVADESLIVQQSFSKTAPRWRGCGEGLNVEGRCEKRSCEAFGKMVISRQGLTAFNITKPDHAACPMCHAEITPLTCGFYNCVWKFEGVRESDQCHISSPWKPALGEKYHRFDADETHGTIPWKNMLIVAKSSSAANAAGIVEANSVRHRKSSMAEWDTCSICWSSVHKSSEITTTTCGHCFHTNCMTHWSTWCNKAEKLVMCSLCRASV